MIRVLCFVTLLLGAATGCFAKGSDAHKPDKILNGMFHFGKYLRQSLPITAAPLQRPLRYAAGNNCRFEVVWSRIGDAELKGDMSINTAAVRDRVAVSVVAVGAKTSLLISPDGRVTNFNSIDPFTGRRTTSANLAEETARIRSEIERRVPGAQNTGAMLGLPMLPRLIENDGSVGSRVAVIDSSSGEWASYYYQGMISYEQWDGVVLDLIQVSLASGTPKKYRIGFLIAEYRTMMPLFFVFENFDRIRAKVISCPR